MGGEGLAGNGGEGGYFYVENYAGGDAMVLKSGTVNTDFVAPTQMPYLGTNPWVLAADATLKIGTSGYHFLANDTTVYDDTGTAVTGIHVPAGVKLTIDPNYDYESSDGLYDTAYFDLDAGFIVEGTIQMGKKDATTGNADGTDTANFYPDDNTGMWIAATGKIDCSGASDISTASSMGANGGWFETYADFFYNAGVIDTSGGSGSDGGGYGGGVDVYSYSAINTGSLLSNGGAGGTGNGGSAGSTYFESDNYQGYAISTGTISAVGGDGETGGGSGGYTYLYAYYGNMLVAGTIDTHGGSATAAASNGAGGEGGDIDADIYGALRWAASVDTHGGNGAGNGYGGEGGYFEVDVDNGETYAGDYDYPVNGMSVAFTGNVNLNGGSGGAYGGDAGYFDIYDDYDYTSGVTATGVGSPVKLVGYTSVDISGGKGSTYGGAAGGATDSYLDTDYYDWDAEYGTFFGSVVNEADFVARGGEGTGTYGGAGANIYLETYYDVLAPYNQGLTNSGNIDASGGKGATYGGYGGYFYLYGKTFVNNTGSLTASGGEGGSDYGGDADEIEMYSDGPITSAGALTFNGGSSASGDGGGGGSVYIQTSDVCTVSGPVTASGGGSSASSTFTGGDGGYMWIMSQGSPTNLTGVLTAAAGAGGTTPVAGDIWLDGGQIAGP